MAGWVAALGIAASAAGTASSRHSARKTRQDNRDTEQEVEARIAEEERLEAAEKRRLDEKEKNRQRAVLEEGRPSTFAAGGQGGLTGTASTKKKKLGQ